MRDVIQRQTGNTILRKAGGHRRRQLHFTKQFLFVTLLTVIAVVQLVVVGRYTIFLVLHRHEAPSNLSRFDGPSTTVTKRTPPLSTTSSAEQITNDGGTEILFRLPEFDFRATDVVRTVGNRTCFVEGLDQQRGRPATAGGCPCKTDWFGDACSVPAFIQNSTTPWSKDALRLRSRPRRVIQAFPFNIEFDMLELRFAELADVVDVFLILESNFTAYGTHKPLHLLERLRNGSYSRVVHKIVYVLLDHFPPVAYRDGWVADALHRNYLGTHGLRRLGGLRNDDLLILTDADELPSPRLLSFLRWHDGYSEPVSITYNWFVFGFFWTVPNNAAGKSKVQIIPSVITVAMAVYVFRYQIYWVRAAPRFITEHQFDVKVYTKMFENRTRVRAWTAGASGEDVIGWHCSWCLDVDGIITKLVSAQNGDFPRWGDYAEKRNATYIKRLVGRGVWFDDVSRFRRSDVISGPPSLLFDERRYWRLIHNVYDENGTMHTSATWPRSKLP